jgi:hypothetical protein
MIAIFGIGKVVRELRVREGQEGRLGRSEEGSELKMG